MAENAVEQQAIGTLNGSARSAGSSVTLADLFSILRKHIATIVVVFVAILTATCIFSAMSPVKYTTGTKLCATYNDSSQDSNSAAQNNGSSYIMSQIKSYPTLATTQSVLQPVIDELNLNISVSALASEISVVNPENTAFVNISVTSTDGKQAAEIANAVARSLSNVVEKSLYTNDARSTVKLSIVQPATVPNAPSSPNWKMNIFVGVIVGLFIGIMAALLKDVLSTTIQDDNDVREYIDAPTIGRIPEDELLEGSSPMVISEPGSPIAEDFRRVRTDLSFIAPVSETSCRLIVVTSTGESEGKTTVSCNIAAALAENGAKVLLIDADLRHPSVAKKLNIDGDAGLTHVLSGQASVRDVVQRFWKPNLHVMPAGPKPPNASTLLNSPIMSELLMNALQQYDYVLIDTAPMVVANDAVIFVRKGGSLVMVSRRNQTRKRDLREISDELDTLDMQVSGIVLNCAKENKKALENSNYYYYSTQSEKRSKKRRWLKK